VTQSFLAINHSDIYQNDAKKDKEESRRVISEQKKKIIHLEDQLLQKTREYERALAAEESKHKEEINNLLLHNDEFRRKGTRVVQNILAGPSTSGKETKSDAADEVLLTTLSY
jgi:hypothetical protein